MNRKYLSEPHPLMKLGTTVHIPINNRILLREPNYQLKENKKRKIIDKVICEFYLGTESFCTFSVMSQTF